MPVTPSQFGLKNTKEILAREALPPTVAETIPVEDETSSDLEEITPEEFLDLEDEFRDLFRVSVNEVGLETVLTWVVAEKRKIKKARNPKKATSETEDICSQKSF